MAFLTRARLALLAGSCVLLLLSGAALLIQPRLPDNAAFQGHTNTQQGNADGADSVNIPIDERDDAIARIPRVLSQFIQKTKQFLTDIVEIKPVPEPSEPQTDPKAATIPLASENVRFRNNIPLGGVTVVGPPGGRFAKNGDQTLFFTTGSFNGVTIFDATNASNPVVIGELLLPHWENEDVDLAGNTLLVSTDGFPPGNRLYVIDISDPTAPYVKGSMRFEAELGKWTAGGAPGHISNCIQECRYAWVTGASNGWVAVVDLGEPTEPYVEPRMAAIFQSPAGNPNEVFVSGTVHDVNVDPAGLVWITGSGGISVYSVGAPLGGTPLQPLLIASNDAHDRNTFILHNSLRPGAGDIVYVTEENWFHGEGKCESEGRFETFSFDGKSISPISTWSHEPRTGLFSDGSAPLGWLCSAHWFDYRNDDTIALAHYQQGVRFLDVSDPGAIREKGWWVPPDSVASAAYFHPDNSDVVYVIDYQRGLDILELCEEKCVSSFGPAQYQPIGRSVTFESSPVWGYACPVVRSDKGARIGARQPG